MEVSSKAKSTSPVAHVHDPDVTFYPKSELDKPKLSKPDPQPLEGPLPKKDCDMNDKPQVIVPAETTTKEIQHMDAICSIDEENAFVITKCNELSASISMIREKLLLLRKRLPEVRDVVVAQRLSLSVQLCK